MTEDDRSDDVARLLAAAGGPEPVPPEVARRLDDTLAELRAERTPAARAEGRRRARWPQALLAAAAVVVAGVAGTTLVDRGGTDAAGGAAGESAADRSLVEEGTAGGGTASGDGPPTRRRADDLPAVPLSAGTLRRDVQQYIASLGATESVPLLQAAPSELTGCATAVLTDPQRTASWASAAYDGEAAVLLLDPDPRTVDPGTPVRATVVDCAGAPVAALTVPAR